MDQEYVPVGAIRVTKHDSAYLLKPGEEWHRVVLSFGYPRAEFWDGQNWRDVDKDWNNWRAILHAQLPPQLWTLPERGLAAPKEQDSAYAQSGADPTQLQPLDTSLSSPSVLTGN